MTGRVTEVIELCSGIRTQGDTGDWAARDLAGPSEVAAVFILKCVPSTGGLLSLRLRLAAGTGAEVGIRVRVRLG